MSSLRAIIKELSGVLAGGTTIGLGADKLFVGGQPSSSEILNAKDEEISELFSKLEQSGQELSDEKTNYEKKLQ
ncbi:hypothetical protein OVS_03895 [Mycoplasma ovis str. Michigan]|uniref:Uncharacterized protein n=1 Tax=Mycoplasma ovis str. Michigan TaxID=1415773 RepID=A0ABN4BM26_9MOLU|nr:hypothetical protein [Mycoplasma ovis]AHC40511.1 hypothetical protein OVS_03895 [Mycoplasma ovis str. Michigan]